MFSPIVIGKKVYYDDTLIGHTEMFAKYQGNDHIFKCLYATRKEGFRVWKVWKPEWRWTKRVNGDGTLAWDYLMNAESPFTGYPGYDRICFVKTCPDWISKSTLDELDQIVNDKFNHWQKLYEAFRRTDNILIDDRHRVQLFHDSMYLLNKPHNFINSYPNYEKLWDTFYEVWKNPDNRIEIWRD